MVARLLAAIMPLITRLMSFRVSLWARFKTFIIGFFQHPLDSIVSGIKSIATNGLNFAAWLVIFEEFFKRVLGWLGIITAVSSGTVGAKQIFDFANAVIDPQEQMLDWLSEAFSYLPSMPDLVAGIDDVVRSVTAQYFTPPLTLTYLLQVTGIGECFNQYLQALISTLIFVFSVFIVRWAFANNFTFTKSVPRA